MKVINKKFSPRAFIKYINELPKPWRQIDKLVFHHTSSPLSTWNGSGSMLHYYNLYKSRGWKTGPHIFIAPDGIWMFTPLSKQGTHAGPEGNPGSIGIEIVGRYFEKAPDDDTLCKYIALVTHILMFKFGLGWDDVVHHAKFHPEGFCSPIITAEWIKQNYWDKHDYISEILRGFAR